MGDVQRIREEKAERSGVCLNLSQILRDGARARAEVNTHACCYTFARLWGGNSVFMKIEAHSNLVFIVLKLETHLISQTHLAKLIS